MARIARSRLTRPPPGVRGLAFAAAVALLAACGSKHDGSGAFPPSSQYAGRCAAPRTGTDPLTGSPYPDRQGTVQDEKTWVRSWIDELYLWYREVPAYSASSYATAQDYFAVLKTPALTPSGSPKDRFHFTYPTAAWEALAQSGVQAGYGVLWIVLAATPPRAVVVAYTEPGGPAEAAGLLRGARVLAVDGVDLANGSDVNTLNAGLFPASASETHAFSILDPGASTPRAVTMTSADVQGTPVQAVRTIATGTGPVGYFLFNDHLATAELGLMSAVSDLGAAGVTDLVVDMRYNGGGYLDVASELGYMVAGPTATAGKTFELAVFNDKYPTLNPVTGAPIAPTPFHATALGFSATPGQPLPSLGLSRVFVLTGPGTCSASEAVMNALSGIDVQVIQIGSTTCGKPYGFYPQDNCGTTYFSIEMRGVNAKGFGDYADGFVPGATLPGCRVADDFTHALGDPMEARLAAALSYRDGGACPAPTAFARRAAAALPAVDLSAVDGLGVKSPWQENRILRR
ncbi:MAG TPA: S41 family peptidase [Anaeromyxobacter sp.]